MGMPYPGGHRTHDAYGVVHDWPGRAPAAGEATDIDEPAWGTLPGLPKCHVADAASINSTAWASVAKPHIAVTTDS
jgi:hypothetical protein